MSPGEGVVEGSANGAARPIEIENDRYRLVLDAEGGGIAGYDHDPYRVAGRTNSDSCVKVNEKFSW